MSMKTSHVVVFLMVLGMLSACSLPSAPASGPSLPNTRLMAEYLTSVRVVKYDPFDDMHNWNFREETGSLKDGMFELRGTDRWHSSFWFKQPFNEGQGLSIRFMSQNANASSELVFVSGDWLTDTFRQFGVYSAFIPKGDLFQGRSNLGGYDLKGNVAVLSNTWYELLMAIGHNGHFLAVVWDPSHDTQRAVYDLLAGANWAGRSWVFLPKANTGETLYVADFYKIAFVDIK
jgi:hypothetical protein